MTFVEPAQLKRVGLDAGLSAVGIADAAPFVDTRTILFERREAGLHDTMQFTYRNPERSTSPSQVVAEAKSLIVGARAYESVADASPPPHAGRIAAYAWRDHYADLRDGLEAMALTLRAAGHVARVVADDNAMVDRAAAVRAGIGWYGKNSNVLLPGAGSFFVLGSVVTDAVLAADEALDTDCGSCRRCLDGCPTDAIIAPGVVDARRCLAWLLQKEGTFPLEFREALGNRIYGCDDCQEVCPPNRARGASSSAPVAGSVVDLIELLGADDAQILDRHGRWYIPRRDVNYVRRNALLALANGAAIGADVAPEVLAVIERYLAHDEPMLRAHAVWAAARVGRADLAAALANDPSPDVRTEVDRL